MSDSFDAAVRRERPAKVLFVIGTLDVGGTETQLLALASRLDRRRFEPIVCSLTSRGPLAAPLVEGGVAVHALGFHGFRSKRFRYLLSVPNAWRLVTRLSRLIRRERPAILHGMLFWAYILATFVGRAHRVPHIVASRRSLGLFKADKPIFLLLERVANRMTDLLIANSDAVREDTMAREGIAAHDILVIRNGLDFTRFDAPADPSLAASLDLPDGPRVIVVSNFIYYKGHEYFLRAWADVLARFPSAVAMLVGDGVRRPELEALVDALGIRRGVRFLGVRHDVPALLALSDVYVHPSLEEGNSNALLEAMAAGKAVVATAVGGNVEAVDDGVTGLLIEPRNAAALADRMLRLLTNRDLAVQMGARARVSVRDTYAVGKMVRAYEAVYDGLLDERAGRPDSAIAEPAGRVRPVPRSE